MTDQSRHELVTLLATAAADVLQHSEGIITGFQIVWSQECKGYMCKLYATVNNQPVVAGRMFNLQELCAMRTPEVCISADLTDLFHKLRSNA